MFTIIEYPRLNKFISLKKKCVNFSGFLTLSQHIKDSFIDKHKNGSKSIFTLSFPVSLSAPNTIYKQLSEYLYTISQVNPDIIHTINFYGKTIDKFHYHYQDFLIITFTVGKKSRELKINLGDFMLKSKLYDLLVNFKEISEYKYEEYVDIDVSMKINNDFLDNYQEMVNNVVLDKILKKIHDAITFFMNDQELFKHKIEIDDDLETVQEKILQNFQNQSNLENYIFYKEYLNTDSLDFLLLIHHNISENVGEKTSRFPVYNKVYKLLILIDKLII